jgi:hypothetical protein
MARSKVKLLVLILSFEEGAHSEVQARGQDATFMEDAALNARVLRYVGKDTALPLKYRLIFLVRRWQYALLDFSNYWPVGFIARLLANSRFADAAIRSIPYLNSTQSLQLSTEVKEPGKTAGKIVTETPEDWSLIGLKTIIAFKHVLKNYEFDYLFRTNTSSYLDVPSLLKFLEKEPNKNLYAGVIGKVFGTSRFASGAGILLSRDVIERICESESGWKHGLVDDIAIADLVSGFRAPTVEVSSLPRVDFATLDEAESADPELIRENFHFRCKSSSVEETVGIMHHIHKVKNSTA